MAVSEPGSRVSAREPFFSTGYRAALERVACLPDRGRSVVALSGAAPLRVVNGLASNDTAEVENGRGTYSYLLDRRGRVVVDLRVLPAPEFEASPGPLTVWLDAPASGREALTRHLEKYVPPILAMHRPTSAGVVSLLGPLAADALGRWTADSKAVFLKDPGELESLEATTVRLEGAAGLAVRREDIEGPGFDLYVEPKDGGGAEAAAIRKQLESVVASLDGTVATGADWEILRVERGLPAFGAELGPDRLAPEAGQDARAISLTKGCFTGQEVVARIHYRGHVNWHLRGIRGGAGTPGDTGDRCGLVGSELHAVAGPPARKPVGVVTSAVVSPRFGLIGLAYLRREIEPGDTVRSLQAPHGEFEVTALPFTNR